MDCCAPGKTEGTDKDLKKAQPGKENNPPKEHTHGSSCCGGTGMKLHLIIMLVVFIAVWYFSKG